MAEDLVICPECEPNNCINCDKITIVSTDGSILPIKSVVDGICTFNLKVLAAFQLSVQDSTTVALTGNGTPAQPLSAALKISNNPLNAITVDSSGLLVLPQSLSETPNSKTDSQTAAITLSGTSNRNILVNVKISAVAGNYLTVQPDGLFVPTPPSGGVGLTVVAVQNSPTINLTGNGQGGNPITATAKISGTAGNAIIVDANGLYVSALTGGRFGVTGEDNNGTQTRFFEGNNFAFTVHNRNTIKLHTEGELFYTNFIQLNATDIDIHMENLLAVNVANINLSDTGIITLSTTSGDSLQSLANGDLVFNKYPYARNDGSDTKFATVDATGNVKLKSVDFPVTSGAAISYKAVNVVQQSKIESSEQIFFRGHGIAQVGDLFFIGTREIPTDENGNRIDEFYNLVKFYNPNSNLIDYDAVKFAFDGSQWERCETACYDSVANRIYMYATEIGGTGQNILISINPANIFTATKVFEFTSNAVFPGPSPAICTDNTYVYGITYEYSPTMFKVRISDWTLIQSVALDPGFLGTYDDTYGHAAGIHAGTGMLIFTTAFGGHVIKADPANLNTWSSIAVTTPSGIPILTDDLVLNGAFAYLGCENVDYAIRVDVAAMTYTTFAAVKSFGMFTNGGTDLWNMGNEGYIERFPLFNTANRETHTLRGFGSPNEFFYSSTGKFFCTTWPTDKYNSRLLEFTLTPAATIKNITVTGSLTVDYDLTVGYNIITKNVKTERIQFYNPTNDIEDLSYDASAKGSIGYNNALPKLMFNDDGFWRPFAQRFGIEDDTFVQPRLIDLNSHALLLKNGNLIITDDTNGYDNLLNLTIQMFNGVAPAASLTNGYIQYAADIVAGNSAPHFRTEGGHIIKLFRGAALTAADAGAINSGDAGTDAVIANIRTRVGEIQTRLQAHGLLT